MRTLSMVIGLTCCALLIPACGDSAPAKGSNPNDPVVKVESDDAKMNAAIDKAKKTLPKFIAALAAPAAGQSDFAVKKPYPTKSGGNEHIWIIDLKYDGKVFKGKVGNDPESVDNLKFDQSVVVAPDEISDWMYLDNGAMAGAYTMRVLLESGADAPAAAKKIKFKD